MTDITAKPFDWNDNLSKEALEDFEGIRKDLPYCSCQNIGMALAKLELLEKQGYKVIDPSGSSSEKPNKSEISLVIDIPEDTYQYVMNTGTYGPYRFNSAKAIRNGIPLPKGHGKKFEGIVVEYPPADLCIYPEYKGKPYFSIKYEENGEHIIGFGTYNPDVLSSFLQEYFIAPTIIEADKAEGSGE